MIRRNLLAAATAVSVGLMVSAAAADTVKVGIIAPLSGPLSGSWGVPFQQGIDTWVAMHGTEVNGNKVELIYRDLPGVDPQKALSLAQELIINEDVQYLGGFVTTPNALAVANIVQQAKVPTVIFNAAGPTIVGKSDYFTRTSNTLPQITVPLANYVAENGLKRIVTAVADYSPGHDAEKAFEEAYGTEGEIVEKIRIPMSTTDFGPFVQKIRLLEPDALFVFLPVGPATYGFVKAYNENGLKEDGIRFFGLAETQESDLQQLGDGAIGMETSYMYSAAHDSDTNREFLAKFAEVNPGATVNPATVMAFDGMHVLYEMIAATDGKRDPEAAMTAVKGFAWESPRGPVHIDADTRQIIQNISIRRVERADDGLLINKEIKTYENVAP
ncbi:branched-chain amino acid transport system substrate-binding protein [Amorphus suaedae]